MAISRLKKRRDFLRAAKGDRFHTRTFSLQLAPDFEAASSSRPQSGPEETARVGFTVTKKLGKATVRNRIRRRLKEALRLTSGLSLTPGRDYVFVAKGEALSSPFTSLQDELRTACTRIGKTGARKTGSGKPKPRAGKPKAGASPA